MRHLFIFFLAFIGFTAVSTGNSHQAFALECKDARPSVVVKTYKKKTKYIRNFTTANLTQLHTGSYKAAGPNIFGLGGGAYGLKSRMKFKIKQQGSLACVSLDSVEGQFVAYPSIMVAKNFRKGTCEYKAVLAHEKKHVRALLDFQKEYARKFKSRLKKIVKQNRQPKVVSASQISQAQEQIQANIQREISAYFDKIKPIIQKRQQAVDSPKEYARVFSLCDGWDAARR